MPRLDQDSFGRTAKALRRQQAEFDVEFDFGWAGIENLMLPPDPNPAELTDHLCAHAGAFALWGVLAKDAEALVEEKQADFDRWYAGMYARAKEVLEKRSTEKAIATSIINGEIGDDEEEKQEIRDTHRRLQDAILEAKRKSATLKVVAKAWDQKQLMLNALSRIVYAEMMSNAGPQVNLDDPGDRRGDRNREGEPAPDWDEPRQEHRARKERDALERPAKKRKRKRRSRPANEEEIDL